MTVQDLITAAMKSAGILAAGEVATGDEQTDALFTLNQLLDSWSAERLLITSVQRQVLSLTANNTGTYQIGPGGADFPTNPRPIKIENAGVIVLTGSTPVEIPLKIYNDDEWAAIEVKGIQSPIPEGVYCDYAYPFSTLYTWPQLNANAGLALYAWSPLPAFAAVTDTVSLPPGFSEAIQYNLAGRLAMEYGKTADPVMIQLAIQLKDQIKQSNHREYLMRTDPAISMDGGRSFNVYNGDFR